MELKGHIFRGQIVDSPDASGAVLPLVLTFARESRGWVRVTCRRAEWSYSVTERRWARGLAPSSDPELLARIIRACEEA